MLVPIQGCWKSKDSIQLVLTPIQGLYNHELRYTSNACALSGLGEGIELHTSDHSLLQS